MRSSGILLESTAARDKRVLGIDASLSCTGLAYRIDGSLKWSLIKGGHLRGAYRLAYMTKIFEKTLDLVKPDLAVIEDYAVNKKMGADSILGLAELAGNYKRVLWDRGIDMILIRPTSMKMIVAGNGRAEKSQVREAVYRLTGVRIGQLDASDAGGLMLTGEIHSGASTISSDVRKSLRLGKLMECEVVRGRLQSISQRRE